MEVVNAVKFRGKLLNQHLGEIDSPGVWVNK